MINLIKIEFKKNKMKYDILGAVLGNIAIFLLSTITAFLVDIRGFSDNSTIFYHIDQIVQLTAVVFIIYGTILLGELIVDEFKEGTCRRLFLYSYSREKIILAKILTIILFVTLSIILTLFIQLIVFVESNKIFGFYKYLNYSHILNNPTAYILGLIAAIGFVLSAAIVAYKSRSTIITLLITIFLSGKIYSTGYLTSKDNSMVYSLLILGIGIFSLIYIMIDIKNIDV